MSTKINDIPFPSSFNAHSSIPISLLNTRLQITSNNLMNSASLLHNYIDDLLNYVYDTFDNDKPSNFSELIAKSHSIEFSVNSQNPWLNYPVSSAKSPWCIYDELMACVISLTLIYNKLTIVTLKDNYHDPACLKQSETWKKSNNYLKLSFSYLDAFKPFVNTSSNRHSSQFLLAYSLNEMYLQLIVVLKNINDVNDEVDARFGNFDELPKLVNTYIRILVFIKSKFNVVKTSEGWTNKVSIWNDCLEVLLCYYLGLQNWNDKKVGKALSLVKCGLIIGLEQGEVKGRIKSGLGKFKFGKKNTCEEIRDKEFGMDEIKIKRKFRDVDIVDEILVVVCKLLKILYLKFKKMNDTISFENIMDFEETEKELFSSNDLPTGLKVPLNDVQRFVPICLENYNNESITNYF